MPVPLYMDVHVPRAIALGLSSRLQKGPITTESLLRYSIKTADALDKSQKTGVTAARNDYAVSADGRFLINDLSADAPPDSITVTLNYPALLTKR